MKMKMLVNTKIWSKINVSYYFSLKFSSLFKLRLGIYYKIILFYVLLGPVSWQTKVSVV